MWVYTERQKENAELQELLELEPVSLVIQKTRLGLLGNVECKADSDWVKMFYEKRGRPNSIDGMARNGLM